MKHLIMTILIINDKKEIIPVVLWIISVACLNLRANLYIHTCIKYIFVNQHYNKIGVVSFIFF